MLSKAWRKQVHHYCYSLISKKYLIPSKSQIPSVTQSVVFRYVCYYIEDDGGVNLTPPVVIECHKTLYPALYRIKRAPEWKPVPKPLCSLLKPRKETSTVFLSPNVSCLYFNPSLCKAHLYQNPLSTTSGLFFAVFQNLFQENVSMERTSSFGHIARHSFVSTSISPYED